MDDKSRLFIGAMSGTSADGVDAALVRIRGKGLDCAVEFIGHIAQSYPEPLRQLIFKARGNGEIRLEELANLATEISQQYIFAVRNLLDACGQKPKEIAAIAAHGQTLFHRPPATIQWLDPALIAAQTGIDIVSDFRRADCAAGGQGAPLVPLADYLLFRDAKLNRIALNLGGIANITWLPARASIDQVIAFDTGPANCVIDHLARKAGLPGGIDLDGELAARGKSDFAIADSAIRNWKSALRPPPKSTDGPEMIDAFDRALHQKFNLSLADRLATACTMSALGIKLSLEHLPDKPDEIIVSGGGLQNRVLIEAIKRQTELPLRTTDERNVPSQAKEAVAFAIIGAMTLDRLPGNVPSATGANRPVVLGSITPKP